VASVRDLKIPLAVLHRAEDGLVNAEYFASVPMPTLWRGAVQRLPGAGHTPQWETPEAFDALVTTFVKETAQEGRDFLPDQIRNIRYSYSCCRNRGA